MRRTIFISIILAYWATGLLLQARLNRIPEATCSGSISDLGIKSTCKYKGLLFLLMGQGVTGSGYDVFARNELISDNSIWSFCSIHIPKTLGTSNSTINVYEECRKEGGVVATGHRHSYARSFLMNNFATAQITNNSSLLEIAKGRSFTFISGLGGKSVSTEPPSAAWWASLYTGNQSAKNGALLCTFNVDNQPNKARCYFKNIDNEIIDIFDMASTAYVSDGSVNQAPTARAGNDQIVTDTNNDGLESVALDGSASSDADGVVTSYEWRVGNNVLATTATTTLALPLGLHDITLEVTDNLGVTSTDIVRIEITTSTPVTTQQIKVSASADDAEEKITTGKISLTSSDLELTYDSGDQQIGMRFLNRPVAQ